MLESQTDYVLAGIRHIGTHGNSWANVRRDSQEKYNRQLQDRLQATVWEAGCTNWYRTASGRNTNNWPSYTLDYRRATRFFDAGNYEIRLPTAPGSPPPAAGSALAQASGTR